MEILEKLGIDWKLLLAQAVNFLILLWVLRRYAYKPILKALEARTKKIEQGLKDAETSQSKLQSVIEEEKKILVAAREEARNILVEAEASAKKRDTLMLEETKEKIDRMIVETDKHLGEKQARLLREAKEELAETVMLATKKILGEKVDASLDGELIKKSLQ